MASTIQTLFDYQSIRAAFPEAEDSAIDDYYAKTVLIRQLLDQAGPELGTGSPEGVVTSTLSQMYIDTAGPTQYYNPNVGVDTGWVAL